MYVTITFTAGASGFCVSLLSQSINLCLDFIFRTNELVFPVDDVHVLISCCLFGLLTHKINRLDTVFALAC